MNMGWIDDAKAFIENVVLEIVEFVGKIKAWLENETGKQVTELVVEGITWIVKVVGLFNEEPSDSEKREIARAVTRFYKYAPAQTIARLSEIKASGEFDDLTSADMDMLLGAVIGAHVADSKRKPGTSSGKTPARGGPRAGA